MFKFGFLFYRRILNLRRTLAAIISTLLYHTCRIIVKKLKPNRNSLSILLAVVVVASADELQVYVGANNYNGTSGGGQIQGRPRATGEMQPS